MSAKEELPKSFETTPEVKKEAPPTPVPEKAAEWLLQVEKANKSKVKKEKKSKPAKPAVEQTPEVSGETNQENPIENKAEVDFERRHEVLDEPAPVPPPITGMVPLSQVLAEHPAQAAPNLEIPLVSNPQPEPQQSISVKPLVRSMVLGGILCGIALILTLVFIFDK